MMVSMRPKTHEEGRIHEGRREMQSKFRVEGIESLKVRLG
jgi:hypothetical protein